MPLIRLSSTIALMLLTSCVGQQSLRTVSPPTEVTFSRSWTSSERGFLHVASYFTRGQVDDPAWEAFRMKKMGQATICKTGQSITRRDVRWFPATRVTGQECAAIIYTITCDVPTNATVDSLEQDRQEALLGEMDYAPEKGCGQLRSGSNRNAPSSDIKRYLATQAFLVDGPTCDLRRPHIDGRISILPTTRIGVTTKVEKALAVRLANALGLENVTTDLDEDPEGIIGARLRASGKMGAIFPPDGKVARKPENIQLNQSVGLGSDGRPYCVQLTARQGDEVWRRTIERSGASGYAAIGLGDPEAIRNAKRPRDDQRDLIEALATTMELQPRPQD